MSDYTISIDYAVQNDTAVAVSNTSISPSPPDGSKTGVADNGDVTMGKGDTATITYNCNSNGWHLSEIQLKSKGRSHWGPQSGRDRLDSDAAEDFPGVDANSGRVNVGASGQASIADANKKSNTVDYRFGAKKGSTTIWSDPSVKNNGN
jgi:hypothetical protein